MEPILHATDLSTRAECALDRAHGRRLIIVHVIDEDQPAALAEAQQGVARQLIDERVGALNKETRASVTIEVVTSRPHQEIQRLADNTGAELIVIGMHHEGGFKDMFRGQGFQQGVPSSSRCNSCPRANFTSSMPATSPSRGSCATAARKIRSARNTGASFRR